MLSLASVVSSDFVDDWKLNIAHTHHPFAQFHTKFWGVEEVAAYTNHIEIDDSTADDGDINLGCYILDIGTRGKEDKIWVCAEYTKMFEFSEKFYTENVCNTLSPCLVITGQPGIGELSDVAIMLRLLTSQILQLGKSVWHWYAL
jgi:hypothetical protein